MSSPPSPQVSPIGFEPKLNTKIDGIGLLRIDFSRFPASVQAERVRALYRNATTGLVVNLLLGSLMAVVLWEQGSNRLLIAWYLSLIAIIGVRAIRVIRFNRAAPDDVSTSRWRREFALGSLISGSLWGGLGWWFMSDSNLYTQVWVTFALGGMVAGAPRPCSGPSIACFSATSWWCLGRSSSGF